MIDVSPESHTFLHREYIYIYTYNLFIERKKNKGTVIKYLWNNWTMTIFSSSVDNEGIMCLYELNQYSPESVDNGKFFNQVMSISTACCNFHNFLNQTFPGYFFHWPNSFTSKPFLRHPFKLARHHAALFKLNYKLLRNVFNLFLYSLQLIINPIQHELYSHKYGKDSWTSCSFTTHIQRILIHIKPFFSSSISMNSLDLTWDTQP